MPIARPELAKPTPYSFPKPCIDESLSNGIRVLGFNLPGQYIISCRLVVPVPLSAEPTGKEGISALSQNVALSGTNQHPGISFAEAVVDQGMSLTSKPGHFATFFQADFAASRLEAALGLFAEVVSAPETAAQEVERQRKLQLANIDQLNSNPSYLCSKTFTSAFLAEKMRMSRPNLGDAEQLNRISVDDVVDFQGLWSPTGSTLVIAGELPDDLLEVAEKAFSVWQKKTLGPLTPEKIEERADGPFIWVVDRPEAVQANVQIGAMGIGRDDKRWPAFSVACLAVGGSFGSRLNSLLREDLGYTYGARLSAAPVGDRGMYNFSSSFRTEVTADAIDQTLKQLSIEANPLTEQEVEDAKNYILGISPMVYNTSGAIASQVGALIAAGLETDYISRFDSLIQEVNPAAANTAFTSVVSPKDCNIVIVGNAEKIVPAMAQIGYKAELI